MEEFEKMAAIELDEPEAGQEPKPRPRSKEDLSLELDANASEEPADEAAEEPQTTKQPPQRPRLLRLLTE